LTLAFLKALITAYDKLIGTISGNHIPPSYNGQILTVSKEDLSGPIIWIKTEYLLFF
jgi:hypothetical protein